MKIEDIDFNEMYIKQKEKTTFKSKDKNSWNKKALSMNKSVHKSMYNKQFLEILNTKDCETLIDMGCGVGNLSLLLSTKFKNILALDFSSTMLEVLNQNAKDANIKNIKSTNISWYDSWQDIPKADLVIASRCMEVKDMKAALIKLHNQANKRVVVSYKVGGSFVSDNILKALKKEVNKKPDYIYVLNILYSMGINACVNFIKSEGRNSNYENYEAFEKSITWSLGDLNEKELVYLEEYYNLEIKNKTKNDDYVQWAFISWDKE